MAHRSNFNSGVKSMKTKLLVIIGLLIIVSAAMVAPVAALIEITVTGDISDWALTPGTENTNATVIDLTVTSDTTGWTVSVKDALDDLKPAGSVGKMAAYNTTAPEYVSGGDVLETAMHVEGATTSNVTGTEITLSGSDQTIETGLDEADAEAMDITIRQTVTKYDPRLLTANHKYRIVITFTGATP